MTAWGRALPRRWGDLMTSTADATTAIGASLRSTDATLAQRYDRMAGEAAQ